MTKTAAFLWRCLFAAFAVVIFWLVFPLFMDVIGFSLPGNLQQLMKVCIAIGAVIYVLFGGVPTLPWSATP